MALHGSWIWYELMTSDPAGAKAFYEAVVGWSITPGSDATAGYGFIGNADGGMTGGVLTLTPEMVQNGARAGWLGYIGVDDADAAVDQAREAGAKVLMPASDVSMAGRIALLADPDGAPFYVMTPNMPADGGTSTAFAPTTAGRCGWNELVAAGIDGALAFYTGLFGWTLPEPMDMGPHGKYHFFEQGGVVNGAMFQGAGEMGPPHWNHYFRVTDIDQAAAAVTAHGGQVVNGPMQVPGGDWIVHLTDPEGAFCCLVGARPGAA
jgi:uncharacterized protein